MLIESRKAKYITVDGRELIIFSSNDYFGFSYHPDVIKAALLAMEKYGCGTGGAPGTSGTTDIHIKLAKSIAEFKHRPYAVLFPSGYSANVGLHQSLAYENTIIFSDQRNHPSAGDGIKLSSCDKKVYKHRDYDNLEELLSNDKHQRRIVTTCSVFTIDGAVTDLKRLVELKEKYGFLLILDEAHATGCIGETGRGLEEVYHLEGKADFIMGTFSKAFGSQGGFIAYSDESSKYLKKPLRPMSYSTSIATPSAAASLEAIKILRSNPDMVAKMRENITRIHTKLQKDGLSLNEPGRHIVNIYYESEQKTSSIVDKLKQNGFFVVPINIDDRSGLRITAMSVHTNHEIDGFCKILKELETK